MKNIFYLILLALFLQSCAVKNKVKVLNPLNPNKVELHVTLDDIIHLGTTEVFCEYANYGVGLPPLIFIPLGRLYMSINDEPVDNGYKQYIDLSRNRFTTRGFWFRQGIPFELRRALWKAYEEYPEADYYEVKNLRKETHTMFLGRKIKHSGTVKAFKYRYPQK